MVQYVKGISRNKPKKEEKIRGCIVTDNGFMCSRKGMSKEAFEKNKKIIDEFVKKLEEKENG